MARFILEGTWRDGKGNPIKSGTVYVYLAGTTTAASVYAASTGGSAVNSVTTDATTGGFSFYVDNGDYANTQKFKITFSKTNFQTKSYDDIKIFPASSSEVYLDNVSGKFLSDLMDGGYDVPIKPSKIFGGANNTNGHAVPNVADDTFVLLAGTQTLTNKTLTTPTVGDFTNATHDHSNNAGGGNLGAVTASGLTMTGDTFYLGSGSGVPYGEIYVAENTNETTITALNVFVQITDFDTNGVSNLMTPDHTNDHITVTKTGDYKASVTICLDSAGGAAAVFHIELFINNGATAFPNVNCSLMVSGIASEEVAATLSGIVSLTANDTVEVWIKNASNTENIIVEDITLSLIQVGG